MKDLQITQKIKVLLTICFNYVCEKTFLPNIDACSTDETKNILFMHETQNSTICKTHSGRKIITLCI